MYLPSLTLLLFTIGSVRASWNYTDQAAWEITYPDCAGSRQSPVNIVVYDAVKQAFPPLKFTDSYFDGLKGQLFHDGHVIQFAPDASEPLLTVTGGPVGSEVFQFAQFHFHWGADDSRGAEHTIGLQKHRFPLEVHLVHFNKRYGDISSALAKSDGILVLTFWFRLDYIDDERETPLSLQALEEVASPIHNPGDSVPVTVIPGLFLTDAPSLSRYFTYEGSLTTPPCSEAVRFLIFRTPILLNRPPTFIEWMRTAYAEIGGPLVDTYRKLQPLNGRTIYRSF